ncbi:nodulation protein NfeD [Paenibacillus yanchengensis]|uniref:Nodulation protein NfeD n=1 Tax=Paenibacillus yanchengensis TaxID=2035833 RepID=A0ABW4YKH5_9BACL
MRNLFMLHGKKASNNIIIILTAILSFMLIVSLFSSETVRATEQSTTDKVNSEQVVDDYGAAVYVIPVEHTIESGLTAFLKRAFKEAEEASAAHIILKINTYGGEVTSAEAIGKLLRESSIPITAFVEERAVSAGTYIALNADKIVMQSSSTIGAAAVVNGSGEMIESSKVISYWVERMIEAAKHSGRDPAIAVGMVDPGFELELSEIGKQKRAGEILSLSHEEALTVGYSDQTLESVEAVIQWLQLDKRAVVEVKLSPAEKVARWVVDPYVKTVLLILGIAGILIELFVPGFGVPGIIGLLSFILYFFGHYVAGFAGMEAIVMFVLGLVLIVAELFIPSFGILGITGGVSVIAGVVFAAGNPMSAFISLLIAFVVAIIIVIIVARTNKGKLVWNKFILREKLTTEEGFLSAEVKTSLIGKEGITITKLRPAGTIEIDGERFDVVTAGEFVDHHKTVIVTKAEGTWIVVRELVK